MPYVGPMLSKLAYPTSHVGMLQHSIPRSATYGNTFPTTAAILLDLRCIVLANTAQVSLINAVGL